MKKLSATTFLLFFFSISTVFSQVENASRKFKTMLHLLERAYVDTVNSNQLTEVALVAMLKQLDPHSVYISKKDLKQMNEPLVGNFDGIGVQFNILDDTISVVSPISGGPSEKLGIRSGDKIVEIEHKTVAGIGIKNKDVMTQLRGKKGTQVLVGIKRRGVKNLIEFNITRDKIPIYSVDASYMATKETGYIKVNRFAAKTMVEFTEDLTKLKAQGLKNLILDLRGNGGGYLNTAIKLADEFLGSQKLIVYTEGRSYPKDEKFATSKGDFEHGKLVVLINEGSASASEIVSGAIQDWDRGLIIGRRSFGKGLVQKPFSLGDGSAVRLTISKYYTPTGRNIQKPYDKGIKEYHRDIANRFKRGEQFSMDSINFPDSLKFKTPNGRTVYGGGGIMPDIFVPLDTSFNSELYINLIRKGIINHFSLTYLDANRKNILASYPNLKTFKANFKINNDFMNNFFKYAKKEGIEKDEEQYKTSERLIKTLIKANFARDLWDNSAFFEIYNPINKEYQKALEVIKDETFKKMKLNYN